MSKGKRRELDRDGLRPAVRSSRRGHTRVWEGAVGMRTRNSGSVIRAARCLIFTAGLALACTDTPTGTTATYTVGGTVSGLAGSGSRPGSD